MYPCLNLDTGVISSLSVSVTVTLCLDSQGSDGRMSQTGPKKCFIPQNCEKYTNFD